MEKYNLTQTGQEVQDILDNATPQSDLTVEVERAQDAERLLGEGIQQNATDIDSIEGKIPSAATSENKLTDKEYVDGQVDAEATRAQGAESTLQDNIDAEEARAKAAEKQNADDIDAIEEKIPSGATSENKLATESYVNDAVATSSATFRGTFNLVSDLHLTLAATHANIVTALAAAIETADNNDFAFVQIPVDAETPTVIGSIERYKFNGTDWTYEYTLNNSGFTQAQWDAINSGITSNDVTKLAALPTNAQLTTLLNGKQDTLTFDNVPTENSLNPVKSGGVYSAIKDEETRAKAAEKANADDIDAIEEKIPSSASSSNQLATASDVDSLSAAIEAILLLIPSAATSLNQLADKAFVNSSIATATATFRGTFNLVNDLHLTLAATHAQIGNALALAILDSDNNDYCFVQIPTVETAPNEIAQTDRYKFNGSTWEYEYTLNNSGFTSAQWIAINSGITSVLVSKLSALPTNSELTSEFGALTTAINDINLKIPAAAAQNNKLVDTAALESYIVQVLGVLTVSYDVTSTDGHFSFHIEQVDGKITDVDFTTSDVASQTALDALTLRVDTAEGTITVLGNRMTTAEGNITSLDSRMTTAEGNITSLDGRVSTNETDIAQLQAAYEALTQSDIIIGALPASGVANKIYRVPGTSSYSDYMWNGTQFVLMATYNNAIDPRPKKGSTNLVESGGVFDNMGALDISELNATENPHTLATYADLSAALAAIPSNDYKKGGMSIKFVQTDDNKYVQFRCMANSFTTDTTQWQGVDDEPTAGSKNLIESGAAAVIDNKVEMAISALYNEKRTVELDDMQVFSSGCYTNIENAEAGIITSNDNHRIVMFDVSGCTDIEGQYASSSFILLLIFVKDTNGNIIASYSGTGTTDKFHIHANEPFSNGCVAYINDFNYSQVSRNLQSIDVTYENPYTEIDKDLLSIDNALQMQDDIETMAEVTMPDFSNAGYINVDGELITPSSFHATDFLPVVGGSKLTCKLSAAANIAYVAFYTDDSEEDFLSVSNANTGQVIEIQVPSTANYFRASTNFNTSSEAYISDASVKYLTLDYGSKRLKDIEDKIAALTPKESKIITTKKWVAIGDSITWLDGHKQGVAERPEHGYQHYLQQRIQFSECVNDGISGKTMFDYPFGQITTQGDIYSIALGINDWSDTKLTPVGTLADYKNYVTATGTGEYATVTNFAEALARLIIKIKRVSTNAFVILITPKRSNSYTSQTAHFPATSMEANAGGIYLHQYTDIIKEVAEYEGYPCVDLYHNGGFTDQNMSALCYDNLHPNDIGMMLIANDLYPEMEKICRSYIID